MAARSSDLLAAGPGDDAIHAADGGRDTVVCGGGRDVAYLDQADVAWRCERVRRAAPAGAG